MALPHFTSIFNTLEPIDTNLRYVVFDNNDLNNNIHKIKSNRMYFNVGSNNNKIEPLETIMKMIIKKQIIPADIINTNKAGTVLYRITFNNFEFISINNLFDFDYSKPGIMELDVTYDFESMEYTNMSDPLICRLIKINKILKKDNSKFIIKLSKKQLGM